jgi:hypothetical protein
VASFELCLPYRHLQKTSFTQSNNRWVQRPTKLKCNNQDTDLKRPGCQMSLWVIQYHNSNVFLSPIMLEKYCAQSPPGFSTSGRNIPWTSSTYLYNHETRRSEQTCKAC